jgi:hypothetical protein
MKAVRFTAGRTPCRRSEIPRFQTNRSTNGARDLARLIQKLLWIGANDEAEELQRRLRLGRIEECFLTAPRETD